MSGAASSDSLPPADWAQLIVDHSPDGVLVLEPPGTILHANAELSRLTGYSNAELVGGHFERLVPPRFIETHRASLARYLAAPRKQTVSRRPATAMTALRKGGSELPIQVTIVPIETGAGLRLIVFVRDATALRTIEDRLRRLQSATAQLSAAVGEKQVAEVIFNSAQEALGAATALLALSLDDGRRLVVVHGEVDLTAAEKAGWRVAFRAAGAGGHHPPGWPYIAVNARTPLVDAVREQRPVWIDPSTPLDSTYPPEVVEALQLSRYPSIACLPLLVDEPGRPRVAIGGLRVSFDASRTFSDEDRSFMLALADQGALALHRARLYDEAQAARQQAERATALRDQFLAAVSHELRAPLAALLLWEKLLRDNPTPEMRERALAAIHHSAVAQSRMVDDLLDVARGISGKLRMDASPVSLDAVLRAVVEQARPGAAARGVDLWTELPPRLGVVVGDEVRLRQVFGNLLSNAVKFSAPGGRVALAARPADDHVTVEVSDTGRGFPPEQAALIFEPFYQGGGTGSDGGLGLGLAIARQLVLLHGGSITGHSDGAGRGARFVVTLPISSAADTAPRRGESELSVPLDQALTGVRILLVDDDPHVREALVRIFTRTGAQVRDAASAEAGWRALDAELPDVVVCDIAMPETDGYAFIRHLRESDDPARQILPALALTAHATVDDRERALSAGFDTHLAKPIEVRRLVEAVRRVVRGALGSDGNP